MRFRNFSRTPRLLGKSDVVGRNFSVKYGPSVSFSSSVPVSCRGAFVTDKRLAVFAREKEEFRDKWVHGDEVLDIPFQRGMSSPRREDIIKVGPVGGFFSWERKSRNSFFLAASRVMRFVPAVDPGTCSIQKWSSEMAVQQGPSMSSNTLSISVQFSIMASGCSRMSVGVHNR